MKGCNTWSHKPYRPLLKEIGHPYICRIAPDAESIHFEWLDEGAAEYEVYARVRDTETFTLYGKTNACQFDLTGLATDTDYEFYVKAGKQSSRVRLARTGAVVGTVVNYLHPDDEAYAYSGRYLCSPSLVRHPDGFLLASMDLFDYNAPQNLTLIYRSDDDGKTWYHLSELMPCFWGKMFIHKGELYMLACSTEYGDLLIGKSTDGGKTFSAPVCLLRGSNGKNGNNGVHKNPQNLVVHNHRLYNTLEWGTWANKEYCHAAMVMSIDVDDDLMCPENWSFTEPKKFAPSAPEIAHLPECTMTIEGSLAVDPDGQLFNIMRFGGDKCAIVYRVDPDQPEAPLTYERCMPFPANRSKFMIKCDPLTGRYYSVANRIKEGAPDNSRNLLSLMVSEDLKNWTIQCDLIDRTDCDPDRVGFQYVDFEIEGDDLIFLCRVAINNAHNFHDANYSTFHRIPNFRQIKNEK